MRNKHVLSQDTIFRIAHELKKQGKVIGLTHGAFDLFHSTHLDLLQKSSKMCDFLIVGVDSDESVAGYKSYLRPIIKEKDRLSIVNELNCVDAVFIKTAEFLPSEMRQELYKEINPTLITIGQNYAIEEGIRYDTRKTKIRLEKIDTVQNYATSQIIEKILRLQKQKVAKEEKRN